MPPRPAPKIVGTPEQVEQVVADLARQQRDSGYWMSKCFLVDTKKAVDPVRPLRLDPVRRPGQWAVRQAEQEQLRRRGRCRLYVIKGRRAGITSWAIGENFHSAQWFNNRDVWMFAHTDNKTRELFEICALAKKLYPKEWLFSFPEVEPREAMELEFKHHSHFRIGTAGSADIARGAGINRAHVSEFAFIRDPEGFLNATLPALEPVHLSSMILESTPNQFGSDAHKEWLRARSGESTFESLFLPWWLCCPEDYRIELAEPGELGRLEDDERALVEAHGLALPQIKWRRETMRNPGGRLGFLVDYAEDPIACWRAAAGLRFNVEHLRILSAKAPAPKSEQSGDTPAMYYMASDCPTGSDNPLKRGERAIIGADIAEGGGGGDSSAWVAREFKTWRILASFASPSINPTDFGMHLAKWGKVFADSDGTPAFVVPERNFGGGTVIGAMRDGARYPTRSIYHRAPIDKDRQPKGDRIGWLTSGGPSGTKHLMLDALELWFRDTAEGELPSEAGPITQTVEEALSVLRADGGNADTNGRDYLVAESLALMGRTAPQGDGKATW